MGVGSRVKQPGLPERRPFGQQGPDPILSQVPGPRSCPEYGFSLVGFSRVTGESVGLILTHRQHCLLCPSEFSPDPDPLTQARPGPEQLTPS